MAIAELVMPKMGESIMEATILRWHKKVGDHVNQDETVLDIATDKVDSEIPSTTAGTITEILFNVNDVVAVGTVIARIETAGLQAHTTPGYSSSISPVPPPQPAVYTPSPSAGQSYAAPVATPSAAPAPPVVTDYQPPYIPQPTANRPAVGNNRFFSPLVLNIANSEGLSLSELERVPGTGADGRVSKKDVLQYISDKKAGKVPAFVSLQQTPVSASRQTTPYPQSEQIVIPHSLPEQEQVSTPYTGHQESATHLPTVPTVTVPPQEVPQPQPVYIPPFAQAVEVSQGGTVVNDRVTAPQFSPAQPVTTGTVQQAVTPPAPQQTSSRFPQPEPAVFQQPHNAVPVAGPVQQPAIPEVPFEQQSAPVTNNNKQSVEIIEMDRMRKLIAKHMVESKHTSAHVTSFAEADVTNMVIWRNRIKHDFEQKAGTKITFTPMFIECLIKVIKRFPILNSSVIGDTIAVKSSINIGMATALPDNNLIVPVIKNTEQMGLVSLAKSVNTLADNARHNKLKPEDIQDGTFTFTNVGTFGSLMGTPIINQPQVAILAVGIIKKRPVVIETDAGDFIGIRHMIYLSLSYDHRIIDGSVGASFLTAVAREFENWDVNRELKLVVKEQYVD